MNLLKKTGIGRFIHAGLEVSCGQMSFVHGPKSGCLKNSLSGQQVTTFEMAAGPPSEKGAQSPANCIGHVTYKETHLCGFQVTD